MRETAEYGLVIKNKEIFEKYKKLTDGNIIYFDKDIEGIIIDIEDILEFNLTQKYQFVKEIEPNMFYYSVITIYEE